MVSRIIGEPIAHRSNWRSDKKWDRNRTHPAVIAMSEGDAAFYRKKNKRNPYPPGVRHDAWNRGYEIASKDEEN